MKLTKLKTNAHGGWDVYLKDYNTATDSYDKRDIQDCQQEPLDKDLKALDALKSIFIEICDLPKDWADSIDITGFTISWQKNEHMKITVSGIRHLQLGGPLNISSPLRNVTAAEEGATNVLSDAQAVLVDKAMIAGIDYYRGERKVSAKEVAHRTAYDKGAQAFGSGFSLLDNPYDEEEDGKDAVNSWIQGFTDAEQTGKTPAEGVEDSEEVTV